MLTELIPWVRELTKKVNIRGCVGMEVDDLVGYGLIGLADAMRKFDASMGVKFRTYAEFRVLGEMRSACRRWRDAKRSGEPRVVGSIDCGGFQRAVEKWVEYLEDNFEAVAGEVESQALMEKVMEMLNLLPEDERDAIFLKYFMKLSQEGVARRLGISHMQAHRAIRRGVGRLRAMVGGE